MLEHSLDPSGRSAVSPRVPQLGLWAPVARLAPEPFLTVREVAARLRISTATVYAICERGELAHVRVSNAIRVQEEEIDAYLGRKR